MKEIIPLAVREKYRIVDLDIQYTGYRSVFAVQPFTARARTIVNGNFSLIISEMAAITRRILAASRKELSFVSAD